MSDDKLRFVSGGHPEVLRCPAYSKRDRVGYKTDDIKGFDKVGCLPKTIKVR